MIPAHWLAYGTVATTVKALRPPERLSSALRPLYLWANEKGNTATDTQNLAFTKTLSTEWSLLRITEYPVIIYALLSCIFDSADRDFADDQNF